MIRTEQKMSCRRNMKLLAVTSYRSDVSDMFWPKLGHLQALTESKVDLYTVQKFTI